MKCKVSATREELESIGCSENISFKMAEHIRDYSTGYCQIKVRNDRLSKILGEEWYNYYDVPKIWLIFNNE